MGTVLYAILTSVALAFIGVADLSSWSLGTMLYWAQSRQRRSSSAPGGGTSHPGVCVALLGMSLVLLNFGLDEIGNPRLRRRRPALRVGRRALAPDGPDAGVRAELGSAAMSAERPAP